MPAVVTKEGVDDKRNTKTNEAVDVKVEGDQSGAATPVPPLVDIHVLFDTEEKVQTMLAFVLDELLSYQEEVQLMLAECTNSVQIALDVVPRMTSFVEATMRKGLRRGILNVGETQDDEESGLKEGDKAPPKEESTGEVQSGKEEEEGSQKEEEDDVDGDQSSLETNEELEEKEVVPLGDTTYDHVVLNLEAFLSICAKFCVENKQSPLHDQLMLFEKKFIPFKKAGGAVGFS
jgi:hypothetical protein